VVSRRLVISLIAVLGLALLGGGTALVLYHPSPDGLAAEIDAKVGALGVEPGHIEFLSQKALRVRAAIAAGDFMTADRIAGDILAHSRVESWRFFPFDDFIADIFATTPRDLYGRVNQWVVYDPGPVSLLFRAQAAYAIGWEVRGHNFSSKTARVRMAWFFADMDRARADINDAIRLDDQNPYAFYLKLRILQGRGMSSDFATAFRAAIAKFPNYYPLYQIALSTLQPRWHGSIAAMYAFVDRYAGDAAEFSPRRLLYVSLYRHLLNTASVECTAAGGDYDKTVQCIDTFMKTYVPPDIKRHVLAALQLYDHTDKYEFGLAVKPILSDMLATYGGDSYSGTMLQLAAAAMHSDTQLADDTAGRNDYIVDELVAQSWRRKGFADNEVKKYTEAVADAKAGGFPSRDEKDYTLGLLYERLSEAAEQQHQYADEIAYEKAAVLLGVTWDEHYICYGYYQLKRYADAVKACTEAIGTTDNASAIYWRGKAYGQLGQPDLAIADLTRSADQQGYFAAYAAIAMTMMYFDRNDDPDALKVLNKYQFLYDPNRTSKSQVAIAYNNRCYAHMQLGKLKQALDDCTESLKYGSIPDAFRKQQELAKRLGVPVKTL
jgi:tetratricopeptide (TPR) repeat protein